MAKFTYRILKSEIMAKGWSSLTRMMVEATCIADGSKTNLLREVADHGHGAAILPIDKTRGLCLLVRQWRAGVAFNNTNATLLETCAGLLDADDPEGCVRREAAEELGVNVHNIKHVCNCYSSPGALSEHLSLFTAEYSERDRFGLGGGLDTEHEDIEVIEMPLVKAIGLIAIGGVIDAKTIILLQHAALQQKM